MEVGLIYLEFVIDCSNCKHKWRAHVESSFIEWFDGEVEYNYPETLECPNCGGYTPTLNNESDR